MSDTNAKPSDTPAQSGRAPSRHGAGSQRAFTSAFAKLVIVWAGIMLISLAIVGAFAADQFSCALLIGTLSGMIAMGSLIPGLAAEWIPGAGSNPESRSNVNQSYVGSLFGGMFLRLVATVAMFALCRYQMAESIRWIAALTIGWYVVLTCVEVYLLARKLPESDRLAIAATMETPIGASVVEA